MRLNLISLGALDTIRTIGERTRYCRENAMLLAEDSAKVAEF